ncbi:MAG: glycosyltransferase family 39 protein [Candidatus Omnitrophota bacterium]
MANRKRKQIFLLLLFIAIGFILRMNNLSGRSLWTDEFFTFFLSTGHGMDTKNMLDSLSYKTPSDFLKAKEFKRLLTNDLRKGIQDVSQGIINTDTHPPLYFWIMFFWMKIFGDSVFAVRFFSVILGVLSIPLAYKLTRHLFNENAAVFSAWFVAILAFTIRFSQEARAYSLILGLSLAAWILLLRFEKFGKKLDLFCFVFLNSLGLYTHYFYIFIVFAQFIYFTITYRKEKNILDKFYLGFLSSLLLFSPWAIIVIQRGYNFHLAEWIFGYPNLWNRIYYFFSVPGQYILMFGAPLNLSIRLVVLVVSAFLFYFCLSAFRSAFKKFSKQSLFSLCMFLVPLLGMFFIDIIQQGVLLGQERFWMFPLIGFIPIAGFALSHYFSRKRMLTCFVISSMIVFSLRIGNLQFGPAPKYISLLINKESHNKASAVVVYNTRNVVLSGAYYLNDNIYLAPVKDQAEFKKAIELLDNYADNVFLERQFHRFDTVLSDQPFLGIKDIGTKFKFAGFFYKDEASISKYIKCGL